MDLDFRCLNFPTKTALTKAAEGSQPELMGSDLNCIQKNNTSHLELHAPNHQFLPLNQADRVSEYSTSPKGMKRKWSSVNSSGKSFQLYSQHMSLDDSAGLALGLGPAASSSDSRVSSGTSSSGTSHKDNMEDDSSMDLELGFQLQLGNNKNNSPKKPPTEAHPKLMNVESGFLLQLSLSRDHTDSGKSCVLSQSECALGLGQVQMEDNFISMNSIPVVDEGSTSARWKSGGYIPSLLMAPSLGTNPKSTPPTLIPDSHPSKAATKSGNNVTRHLTSEKHANHYRSSANTKTCQFKGCGKGARGASGLCIAHGGGRRCQKDGCNKGAEGRTVFCKAHGGGRRCQQLGCTKSAEGRTDYCIGHGGGRRCSYQGCERAARGKSGLCIRHGGGKRCQKEGCAKSAEGYSGLCISHGGGRRCQFTGCTKGAQGSTMFCKAHGGGKRCMVTGCNKGAEGSTPLCKGHGGGKRCMYEGGGICPKSVHGGTKFCVAHGGGKRCAIQGCTKSARGRTDFCVRHGGGKRCKFENCGKSAQGSTDFCKAHGGGKRCQWGAEGTPYENKVVQGKNGEIIKGPCDRFARGKTGLCAAHSALVQDWRVHGGGTLGSGIGPGLFHGLASAPKSQNTVTTNPALIHHGKGQLPGSLGMTSSATTLLNIGHTNLNDVEMADMREKGKDGCDKSGENGFSLGNNYNSFWTPFNHFVPSVFDSTLGAPALGRPMVSHCIGQQLPLVGLHADIGVGSSSGGNQSASLIPPQVLVPLSMKSVNAASFRVDRENGGLSSNSLSLPEGRVHGGGLMAMLSRGSAVCDLGQPSEETAQNRMPGSWM